jgi:hypothetical protein
MCYRNWIDPIMKRPTRSANDVYEENLKAYDSLLTALKEEHKHY